MKLVSLSIDEEADGGRGEFGRVHPGLNEGMAQELQSDS